MRIVIRARANFDGEVSVTLREGPGADRIDAETLCRIDCKAGDLVRSLTATDASPVREVGARLLDSLSAHPAIRDSLASVLNRPDRCPIYVRMREPASAEYPWETLFDPRGNRFLALEDQWPIARVADAAGDEGEVRYFTPPMRITAVMSALGVDARDELRALLAALDPSGLDFKLHVITGQRKVSRAIADRGDDRVTCSMLTTQQALVQQISDSSPAILHFFCHGRSEPSSLLEFATRSDHILGRSSINLDPGLLRAHAPDTWLVVLNCCEGARDVAGAWSLSNELMHGTFSAVVGMREPVAAADANLFTRAFYSALARMLVDELATEGDVEIDLAPLLGAPRRELRNKFADLGPLDAAATKREWTNPILYVSPRPLRMRRAEPDYLPLLETLEAIRGTLHPTTPPEQLAQIDAQIATLRARQDPR